MRRSIFTALLMVTEIVATSAGATTPKTPSIRDQAAAYCYSDVMRLCNDAVPDEDRISACMEVKRPQLSTKCRDVYDQASQAAQ